jgi:hypothetical protein
VTHEYVILTGGVVLAAVDGCDAPTAIAWASDTVLAVGTDAEVLAISRGDSRVAALRGAVVRPGAGQGGIEPGDEATFSILEPVTRESLAEIRAGVVVAGGLPGLSPRLDACAAD